MQQDWHKSFFTGVALEAWRRAVTPGWTEADAAYLCSALDVKRGSHILDVPCGDGRHALALADRGACVTGVDIAEEYIAEAQRMGAGKEVQWRLSDMRDLPFESEFDGAFCFGNSFGYLDREGTAEFVKAVARALKPGARFAVETGVAAESILASPLQRRWFSLGDLYMLSAPTYDPLLSRLQTDYTFIHDGKSDTRSVWYWVLTTAEIRRIFDQAGLAVEGMYGGLDRAAYTPGSPRLIVEARRL